MSIWVASSRPSFRLLRLDGNGRVERDLPLPSGLLVRSLLAHRGALWCLGEDGVLLKVDPISGNELIRREASGAAALAAGGGVLWAIAAWSDDWYELEREADEPDRTATNTRLARVREASLELEWVDIGVVPRAIAATEHSAWVVAEHTRGMIVCVDTSTLVVTSVLSQDAGVHTVFSRPGSSGVIATSSSTKTRRGRLALDASTLQIETGGAVRAEHVDFGEDETRSLINPFTQAETFAPTSGAARLAVGAVVDGHLWLGGSKGIYSVTNGRARRVLEFEDWAPRTDGSSPPRFASRHFTSTSTDVWAVDPQAESLWRIDRVGAHSIRRDLTVTAMARAES